jgi:hypothetical protein
LGATHVALRRQFPVRPSVVANGFDDSIDPSARTRTCVVRIV